MKRSELFFSLVLIPLDYLALFIAFVFSYQLRDQFSPLTGSSLADRLKYNPNGVIVLTFEHFVRYINIIIPAMLVIFAVVGLYAIRSTSSWSKRVSRIIIGVSGGEFFILLLFLLKKDFFLPRSTVIYSWILGTLFVIIGRVLVRLVQKALYRRGIGVVQVGIVGENATSRLVLKRLKNQAYLSYQVVGHWDSLAIAELKEKLVLQHIDELLVISEQYSDQDLISLRNYCLENHISFNFVPSLLTQMSSTFKVTSLLGVPTIEVRPTPLEGWGRILKRAFDILVSFLFILLFSPFFLLIALALKIYSPGPLIYKHRRIGKNKEVIEVWKFRSLHWEFCTGSGYNGDTKFKELLSKNPTLKKEWDETFKLKNDPRVSLPGKILRKTSLDELPQFFNSLMGSLSLVGPRPIVNEEISKYGERARILFTVKPGVTGLWQVSGRSNTSYQERIELDTRYIEHWSLSWDIYILAKTAWVLLKPDSGSGAY